MTQLEKCPSCARHVRITEARCPFCESALPESFPATPARRLPTVRLGRGALYAFGASAIAVGSLGAVTACQQKKDDPPVENAIYGGPPPDVDAQPPAAPNVPDGALGDAFDAAGTGLGLASTDGGLLLLHGAYGGPPPHRKPK